MSTLIRPYRAVLKWTVTLFAYFFLWASSLMANHYSGATISYTCMGNNFYTINLDVYLDCAGVPISPQTLNFSNSCGVLFSQPSVPQTINEEVSQLCATQINNSTCHGGLLPGFRRYRFSTNVYLSPCNYWTISWSICCRNSTQNLLNTPGTYAEATLNNFGGICDNSPRFADNGVPSLCVNSSVSYNPGASDPNGNIMGFSLVAGRYDPSNEVTYRPGFTGLAPIPGISINGSTGQLNFFPTVTGNYVVVIKVATYNSANQLIGIVMRDLMFVVMNCIGTPPDPATSISNVSGALATGVSSVAVCQGATMCASLVVTDSDPATVLQITSNATALLPGSTFQVIGTNPATARICWTANTAILPINVFIDISDGACPIENMATRSLYLGSCNLLPVELVSFSAVEERDDVLTEWTTASEQGTDHFTVERSTDAFLFHGIGSVAAIGNSAQTQQYAFKDEAPLDGVSYYRLRGTDTDGTHHFSEIVAIDRISNNLLLAIFQESSGWSVSGIPDDATWALTDATGRTMNVGPLNAGVLRIAQHGNGTLLFLRVWTKGSLMMLKLPGFAVPGESVTSTRP